MRWILLVLLLAAPRAHAQTVVPADSLLEAFISTVGYDAFEASWGIGEELFVPDDLPDAPRIRQTWSSLLTLSWMRRQLRANYLATTSREEIRAMQTWIDTPGLLDALAHDLAAAQGPATGRAEWARRAYTAGALPKRRVRAIDRISRAAGDGEPVVRYTVDMMELLVEHMLTSESGDLTPPPGEIESMMAIILAEVRTEITESSREDQRLVIAGRFADYPIGALEAYARALETAAGADYLRLVVDTVLDVRLDALRLALDSVSG